MHGPMLGPRAMDKSAVCEGKALVQESTIAAERMKGSEKNVKELIRKELTMHTKFAQAQSHPGRTAHQTSL